MCVIIYKDLCYKDRLYEYIIHNIIILYPNLGEIPEKKNKLAQNSSNYKIVGQEF